MCVAVTRYQSLIESDSFKTKKPKPIFRNDMTPAAKNGTRDPNSPKRPPITGPMTKPIPNPAPMSPKFCALFSTGVISAI
jgi:hypothetical protein